jgi:CubicO group peptidase (beta-lactamase class C family)
MSAADLHDKLIRLLHEGVTEQVFTHASVAVVRSGELIAQAATHNVGDVFDVASVTKVATAVLALKHHSIDDKVYLAADQKLSVGELLSHSTGLPAWRPFFAHASENLGRRLWEFIDNPTLQLWAQNITRLKIGTSGTKAAKPTYSDLNFLVLGFDLAAFDADGSLSSLATRELFDPLGLTSMQWGGEKESAVPTGRGRPRAGNPPIEQAAVARMPSDPEAMDYAVDDDNSAVMGGQCGHAGLWSNAADLARLGDALRQCADGTSDMPLSQDKAQLLFQRVAGSRTYGLDTPSGDTPAIGSLLGHGPKGAAGHLGFTGCSLWIDRDAELSIAFLSNAVAVERPNPRIRMFRPRVHELIALELRVSTG